MRAPPLGGIISKDFVCPYARTIGTVGVGEECK